MMHLDEVPIFRFLESRTQTGVFSAVFSIISYWYMYMILLSLAMLWGVLYGVQRIYEPEGAQITFTTKKRTIFDFLRVTSYDSLLTSY